MDALTDSELDDPDLINGKARERIATTTGNDDGYDDDGGGGDDDNDDDDDDAMLCYAIIMWFVVLCHVLHHDMYRSCCMVMVPSCHD